MRYPVGIDLGTTNSAVAIIDAHGKPVIVRNAIGVSITPSVICFQPEETLVGDAAKEMQTLAMYPVAAVFKRQIANPLFQFHANGIDHTATDLSAIILRTLKAEAEAELGTTITQAVITVPAYFQDDARKATMTAGRDAGMEVLQVINEPTAAAVAYGFGNDHAGQRLVVYDLGGGTFDVTVLELTKAGVKVLTSDGDAQLGGTDWDERIIAFVADQFRDEFGTDPLEDAETRVDILVQAESAKRTLTSADTTVVTITYDGLRGKYVLDRAKLEELTADLMDRTVSLTRQALDSLAFRPSDVDGVLLVGGSTRMPMVHRFVQDLFGRKPMGGVNVDEAVALGAAIVAAESLKRSGTDHPSLGVSRSVSTIDVTNHSLGMIAVNADNSAYVNSVILPKNTEIPCEAMRPYSHQTREGDDNVLEIFVTQGEGELPGEVTFMGLYIVHGIPHQETGPANVDVTYNYDRSGTVNVTARSKRLGQDLVVEAADLPVDVAERFLMPPERQTIAEPVTAYLAFDLSGSMTGAPLEGAKTAAEGFLANIDLSHCSLGVIAFSDEVRTKQRATQNAKSIHDAIDDLQACETGVCNAADPFDEIYSLLKDVKGRRFAIVLADGLWERQARAIEYAKRCHGADIDVIAIGFGSADPSFLRAIASVEEAGFFTTLGELTETFSTIAQVISDTSSGLSASSSGRNVGLLSGLRERLVK